MARPAKKSKSATTKIGHFVERAGQHADNLVARIHAVWPQFMHAAWVSGASATLLVTVVMVASFARPQNVDYSFSKNDNCLINPVFLPQLVDRDSDNYELMFDGVRSLMGYPLFASSTCLKIKEPFMPNEGQTATLAHSLLPFAQKQLTINSPTPPDVTLGRPADLPLATSGSLVLHLSAEDKTFSYALRANEREVNCAKLASALLCNLDKLDLELDEQYVFSVSRYFEDKPAGQVLRHEFKTVEAIKVDSSSIKSKSQIKNAPKKISLTTNKPIKSAGSVTLEKVGADGPKSVSGKVEFRDKSLEFVFDEPLARSSKFELTVSDLVAVDDAYQLRPFKLRFSTSGGPKVAGVNIGSYGVGTTQNIVLTLDSEPKTGQNLNHFFEVSGTNKYSLSSSGRQVVISPSGSWDRCNKFTISYKDGLQNKYGISGGSAWQFSSRILCRSISSIGASVKGLGIFSHRFGNGSETVMFVGGTHGNEPSSVYILNSLVDNLEANYDKIPKDKTILVVPSINPDGIAAGTRVNSRNVDLNRNFPANNWKKDVVMPGGQLNKGGGGSAPLSEPESSAIASHILAQSPKIVMNYHAVGSLVIGNGSGNASSVAGSYASSVGYWLSDGAGVFEYDTTGALTDWVRDKHGIPAVLIELSSYHGNEFWNHQSAMWSVINN